MLFIWSNYMRKKRPHHRVIRSILWVKETKRQGRIAHRHKDATVPHIVALPGFVFHAVKISIFSYLPNNSTLFCRFFIQSALYSKLFCTFANALWRNWTLTWGRAAVRIFAGKRKSCHNDWGLKVECWRMRQEETSGRDTPLWRTLFRMFSS